MAERLTFDIFAVDSASKGFVSAGKSASAASGNVAALGRRLDEIGKKSVEARVGLAGNKEALAQLDALQVKLLTVGKKTADPKISLEGYAKASAQASLLDAQLGKLGGNLGKIGQDAGSLGEDVVGLGGSLGKLSNYALPAAIAAGVSLAPVLVTAGTGMGLFGAAALQTVSPIEKAASAAGGLQANMSTLGPAQQQVARGLLGLETNFDSFSKSVQPEILTAFGSGLAIAKTVLADAAPVAKATGSALDGVLAALNTDFKGQEWTSFFQWMAQQAAPDVQLLGQNFIDLANALPPVLKVLQPVGTDLLKITDSASQAIGEIATLTTDVSDFASKSADSASKSSISAGLWGKAWDVLAGAVGGSFVQASGVAIQNAKLLTQEEQVAATQTKALSDSWATLLGLFSNQQAILNADQAVATFAADVRKSGAGSSAAQGDFLAAATAVTQMGQSMQNAHAPASAIYADMERQITALGKLPGLTTQEKDDLHQLQFAAIAAANSTQGWNSWTVRVAQSLENSLIPQLKTMKADTPQVRTDIANLTDAIVNTGTKSAATRADRARLISDLENAGVSARTATSLVDGLERKIGALKGKTVSVGVHGAGSGGVTFTESQSVEGGKGHGALFFKAAGGRIPGWGGGDTVPAMLERGETVVPKHLTPAVAPLMKAHGVPGFAAGGLAGAENQIGAMVPFASGAAGSFASGAARGFASAAMSASVAQLERAVSAAAAVGALAGAGGGAIGGDEAANRALAARMFPQYAAIPPVWSAWNYVAMRESGWNRFARNASSGAYGIPQALPPGKLPFAGQAAGGSHAGPQIQWMWDYMAGRYGGPIGAAAHERAFNWYGGGLDAMFSSPTLIGVGERGPERVQVTPAGQGGGSTYNITVNTLVADRNTGRVVVEAIKQHEKANGDGWRRSRP